MTFDEVYAIVLLTPEDLLLIVRYLGRMAPRLKHLGRKRRTPSTWNNDQRHQDDFFVLFLYMYIHCYLEERKGSGGSLHAPDIPAIQSQPWQLTVLAYIQFLNPEHVPSLHVPSYFHSPQVPARVACMQFGLESVPSPSSHFSL